MKIDIVGAAQPAADYANDLQRNRMFNQAIGGLLSGVEAGANIGIERNQSKELGKALKIQQESLMEAAKDPNLSAAEKAALRNQLNQVSALVAMNRPGASSTVLNKMLNISQNDPVFDLMKALELEDVKGKYKVQAAKEWAAGRAGGFPGTDFSLIKPASQYRTEDLLRDMFSNTSSVLLGGDPSLYSGQEIDFGGF